MGKWRHTSKIRSNQRNLRGGNRAGDVKFEEEWSIWGPLGARNCRRGSSKKRDNSSEDLDGGTLVLQCGLMAVEWTKLPRKRCRHYGRPPVAEFDEARIYVL